MYQGTEVVHLDEVEYCSSWDCSPEVDHSPSWDCKSFCLDVYQELED